MSNECEWLAYGATGLWIIIISYITEFIFI
jgi:hypothetical protein